MYYMVIVVVTVALYAAMNVTLFVTGRDDQKPARRWLLLSLVNATIFAIVQGIGIEARGHPSSLNQLPSGTVFRVLGDSIHMDGHYLVVVQKRDGKEPRLYSLPNDPPRVFMVTNDGKFVSVESSHTESE